MKNSKYCKITSCCWSYRHELLGFILVIIATLLTIVTCKGLGIFAMFLVGLVLCCCKHFSCHMHHGHDHCHAEDEHCGVTPLVKEDKQQVKKSVSKTKKQ